MKNLKDIMLEKLTINKNTKINSEIDYENIDDMINIYKAAYISIMKNKCYSENSTFKKQLLGIEYKDIIDILNDVFKYRNISYDEAKLRKGNIWKFVHDYKTGIQNLINGNTIILNHKNNIKLSGKELYTEYKNIINKK